MDLGDSDYSGRLLPPSLPQVDIVIRRLFTPSLLDMHAAPVDRLTRRLVTGVHCALSPVAISDQLSTHADYITALYSRVSSGIAPERVKVAWSRDEGLDDQLIVRTDKDTRDMPDPRKIGTLTSRVPLTPGRVRALLDDSSGEDREAFAGDVFDNCNVQRRHISDDSIEHVDVSFFSLYGLTLNSPRYGGGLEGLQDGLQTSSRQSAQLEREHMAAEERRWRWEREERREEERRREERDREERRERFEAEERRAAREAECREEDRRRQEAAEESCGAERPVPGHALCHAFEQGLGWKRR
ncbi:hypothetical protein BDK51DRAFT_39960 [Blyttiomyces helicus]|uniref:Uncharacterized protein n=1 Tax=Blyttiomyces helicus TaxID=388810 RepID=A0A4P9WN61_9FUNG|nr:hypothetical protein BDK51DRAFT_39960 [Blyttiomyces helicus]|eukprot:RKO94529.1 hypothetical protein BDK51DRAFT_39960 [Blyttiomyces helicus]